MITTSELARLAGVSQSTVSRSLSDHPSISYETKKRIQALAVQYGYIEQKKGRRTFYSGEHRVIGILVEDRPFFDDLFINYTIGKVISAASKKNYYTIRLPISSNENGSMERLRDFLKANLIAPFCMCYLAIELFKFALFPCRFRKEILSVNPGKSILVVAVHIQQTLESAFLTAGKEPVNRAFLIYLEMVCIETIVKVTV